jgi:hypothetical protein
MHRFGIDDVVRSGPGVGAGAFSQVVAGSSLMCIRNVKPEIPSWYQFMDHTSINHRELVGAVIGFVGLLGLINSGTNHDHQCHWSWFGLKASSVPVRHLVHSAAPSPPKALRQQNLQETQKGWLVVILGAS